MQAESTITSKNFTCSEPLGTIRPQASDSPNPQVAIMGRVDDGLEVAALDQLEGLGLVRCLGSARSDRRKRGRQQQAAIQAITAMT